MYRGSSSKYRGVNWNKSSTKWVARINHTGREHYLGSFEDEEEAAKAYDSAASAQRGEQAQLNFLAEGESGPSSLSKWKRNSDKVSRTVKKIVQTKS
jgi:hypothetical protein